MNVGAPAAIPPNPWVTSTRATEPMPVAVPSVQSEPSQTESPEIQNPIVDKAAEAIHLAQQALQSETANGVTTGKESTEAAVNQADNAQLKPLLNEIEKQFGEILEQIFNMLAGIRNAPKGDASNEGQEALSKIANEVIKDCQNNRYLTPANRDRYLSNNFAKAIEKHNSTEGNKQVTTGDIDTFKQNIITLKEKNASEVKHDNELMAFLGNNSQWLFGLMSLVAKPLSHLFSGVPILGDLLAQLSASSGSILTGLVVSAFTGNNRSNAQEPNTPHANSKPAPPEPTVNARRSNSPAVANRT